VDGPVRLVRAVPTEAEYEAAADAADKIKSAIYKFPQAERPVAIKSYPALHADGALGAAAGLPSVIGGPGSDFTLGAERVDRIIDAVFD
jgi:hypothetical protein